MCGCTLNVGGAFSAGAEEECRPVQRAGGELSSVGWSGASGINKGRLPPCLRPPPVPQPCSTPPACLLRTLWLLQLTLRSQSESSPELRYSPYRPGGRPDEGEGVHSVVAELEQRHIGGWGWSAWVCVCVVHPQVDVGVRRGGSDVCSTREEARVRRRARVLSCWVVTGRGAR